MASAQGLATSQLQAFIAGSLTETSGRLGAHRAGPSECATCDADALSNGCRAGSTSSQVR